MSNNFWNVTSKLYQWFRNKFPFRQILNAENKNLEALLNQISVAGKKVIDIGTGTGNVLPFLGKAEFIAGIDISLTMLISVRQAFPNIHRVQADAVSLPLKSKSADVVIAVGLVEYMKNVDHFLDNVSFVLKDGGYAVVTFSPKGLSAKARLLLGHSIYPRSLDEIIALAKNRNFIVKHHCASLMQQQILLHKK